jgi:hypothetical protein
MGEIEIWLLISAKPFARQQPPSLLPGIGGAGIDFLNFLFGRKVFGQFFSPFYFFFSFFVKI